MTNSNSYSNSFINMNNQPIHLMNIYLAIQTCLLIVERNIWLWYQLLVFIQCYYANSGSVVFKKFLNKQKKHSYLIWIMHSIHIGPSSTVNRITFWIVRIFTSNPRKSFQCDLLLESTVFRSVSPWRQECGLLILT